MNSAGRRGVQVQENSCTDYQVSGMGKSQIQEYRHYLQSKEQAARYMARITGYTAAASQSEDDQN